MRVVGLGHSSYLLEMAPQGAGNPPENTENPVRILADPWIDDFLVGDLLGRFPRIRLNPEFLNGIHGVFISHSHTDHLCPYSLIDLWKQFDRAPTLILPQSLLYLDELFEEFLVDSPRIFLKESEPVDFFGLEITGKFNPETQATNEDDVMILIAKNGTESFLAESDALLPFYHPEARELITSWLDLETVDCSCFLTIKNQGDATMQMLSCSNLDQREERLSAALAGTYQEIEEIFTPFDGLEQDLWAAPHLVRLIGGQGIGYPCGWEKQWNHVLFPIRIEDRVRMEEEVAEQSGYSTPIEELKAGWNYEISTGGKLNSNLEAGVDVIDPEEDRKFKPDLEIFDDFPVAPLRNEARDQQTQLKLIENCLNTRFLPHLVGERRPPVEHLLANHQGEYRIRIRLGSRDEYSDRDFLLTFKSFRFQLNEIQGEAQEHYWANDLEDFLKGDCDEFSLFTRHPIGGTAQRLWSTLGLPYLNQDLIHQKLKLHFQKASSGETAADWVKPFHERK